MESTKRYYTLAEVADLLQVPVHQARRWIKLFLSLPPHKTKRIPAEKIAILYRIREGVYRHRLRGDALRRFVAEPPNTSPPAPDYTLLLGEIYRRLSGLLQLLDTSKEASKAP
ncbi:MAG: helix-turn-helix domain-containing protein [Bacteroidia bacterium]|nr:helix-turn-helix domain-containing protein [Bacteroidia bacterium]MDW8235436.1 helix-turn-helix domain-containing protein [Bacteroidia bacterium]